MGSKSSRSARTPVEAKDSLKSTQFVRILDLLGEGSLSGWGNGGDSDDAMLKSTYFNDTPVLSETGEANFKGAKVAYLLGSEDQGYLPNFDTTENTVAVGTEVKNATPIVRTVTDSQLDRVIVTIRTGQMVRVNDQGDQNRTSVDLVVELMKGGATFSSRHVRIEGKTSDHFFRDVEFEELPESPFQIRVRRVTGDSSSSKLQNQTYFASYVEIINAKLSYPHSAIVGVEFDSELFGSSIPTRNYLVKGLQIKVPSNYDPEARTYTGFWDGTFKVAFSNNPAWVFYDLVTSKRYGLGRKISPNQVDKWSLYSVARYCDQLVDNGQGTMEPRFTCNAYLTEMRQAYEVLQDLVSCFRGMYVWDGQNVSVTIDRKSDPVAMYTNSNVVDGIFSYSSSPLNTIATAVQVQYVDAEDGYRTKTEYVSDDLAVRRYGLNVKRITSFGCTSRSQAIRTGKWLLETSRLERQTVTFSVGRAGLKHLPYDIIQVVDNDYAGVDMAGRIETVNQNLVTLDRPVSDLTGTEFSYLNTLGKLVTSEIVKQVSPTVLQLVDVIVPHVTATFVIRSKGLGKRFFRALTISEDQDNGSYTINAVEHIPEKESVVDNGVGFEPAPNTIYDRLPIITGTQVQQGGDGVVVEWSGQGSTAGVTYQVKVYRDNLLMNTYNDLVAPVITLSNLQPGKYKLEIRARNKNGQWSEPEIREFVIDYNITTLQATPELWSVRLNWTLPNTAGVGYKTQIWYSETDEFTTAQKLADVATPTTTLTHTNLELMQKYYYWARIEDAKGNTGEPSNSVWCGPSTDEKLITEYLKGKVDATLIADGTLTIAKFAKSIVPPRLVDVLPGLPSTDYSINSIVTYQGALYQNIGNVWKPMFDQEALDNSIDQALDKYKEDIPAEVDTLPGTFNGKNFVIYQGRMYVWNGSSYEVTGISPELQKNIPVVVTSIPTTFNGSNNLIMGGQLYAWNGTKYVSQYDENAVDQAIDQAVNDLHTVVNEDLPRRVTSVPASFNGYNNLVLSSTGQMYSWSGTKYVPQFDKAAVDADLANAKTTLSKDIPYKVTSIPVTNNGYNNLVLSTDGQLYTWNIAKAKYLPQFDSSVVDSKITVVKSELAVDIPLRVTSIPTAHNGSNNLVLSSTGQIYSWNGSKYATQFDKASVTAEVNTAIAGVSKDIPYRVTTIPTSYNGFNNLVLSTNGQMYSWNGTKYVVQFDQSAVETTVTQVAQDLVEQKVSELANDVPRRVASIPSSHSGSNMLVLTTTGQVYAWDGSAYKPQFQQNLTQAVIDASTIQGTKIADGTISTNQLAANSVTAFQILAGSITTVKMASNSVTTAQLAAGSVTATQIEANAIVAGKIAANAVTTASIAANAVTANEIAANSITAAKIATSAVTANAIAAGTITGDKIAARSITAEKLIISDQTNLIPDPRFVNGLGAWSTQNSAAISVAAQADMIAGAGVTNGLQFTASSGAIGVYPHGGNVFSRESKLQLREGESYYFSALVSAKVLPTAGSMAVYMYGFNDAGDSVNIGTFTIVPMSSVTKAWVEISGTVTIPPRVVGGHLYFYTTGLTGTFHVANPLLYKQATGELIVDGAITAGKISAGAITSEKIVAGAVTATELAANAIVASKISANAVTTAALAAGAVTANEIAASTITGNKIAANAISASHIVAGTITAAELAANSVTTAKIAALAVTAAELSANSVTAGKIAVNAVTADNIAAGSITSIKVASNSITTDKLYVTAGTNLIPNPAIDYNLTDWRPYNNPTGVMFLSKNAYVNAGLTSNLIRLQVPAATSIATQTSVFSHGGGYPQYLNGAPVKEGDVIRLRYKAFRNTKYTDVLAAYIWGTRPDNTGVALRSLSLQGSTLGTLGMAGVMRELEVTIPSNVVSVRAYFVAQNTPTGAGLDLGDAFIGDVEMFNMTTSQLIVDGAITADKVAANAITVGKIAANAIVAVNIQSNAIGAAHIVSNAISTSHISANAVTTSQIAAGAVTANEIAANTITGNKIAARTIDAGRIITGAITANELAANSITAAKIAAGAVGADQIAANAITADKMVIGLNNNLVPDPLFEAGTAAWRPWSGEVTIVERSSLQSSASAPATRGARFRSTTAATVAMFSHTGHFQSEPDGIPVVAGEQFVLSADFLRTTPSTGNFALMAYFYLQTGAVTDITAVTLNLASVTGGVWNSLSGNITVPAAAVKMRLYLYASNFVGTIDICNPTIFKRTTGELIVDGSITTDKLAANSITSAKILAGSIQAAHIAAGTITGDRIAANQAFSAPQITGGWMSLGNGDFTVDTSGNVKITKGTINVGDNFIVDASGNLTAKSGTFDGNVTADSIDTAFAQTLMVGLGVYTPFIAPSRFDRKVVFDPFTILLQRTNSADSLWQYKIDLRVYIKTLDGTETLAARFGLGKRNGGEIYEAAADAWGKEYARVFSQLSISIPRTGCFVRMTVTAGTRRTNGDGGYLTDKSMFQIENDSYTSFAANTPFTNGVPDNLSAAISRHVLQAKLYRNSDA